jgi:hypothetical protein
MISTSGDAMKLSKDTLAIFKNFSGINANLTIKRGNKLTTISSGKNIIADARVSEVFPQDFGIYDLNEFLGAMSLFTDPELDFTDKYVTIREGKNSIKYYGAAAGVLTPVPMIKSFPEVDIEFDLTGAMLSQIQRVSSILKVSDFSVIGDGSTIVVSVGDKSNPTGNSFSSEIGSTDKTFKVNFKVDNLKMMPGDYCVSIGGKKISRFQSTSQQLTYYVAIELDSTFDF